MPITLAFGSQQKEIDTDHPPLPLAQQPVKAMSDVAGAVAESLRQPIGYPSLADAILEGDRVTIAIGWGVPQLPAVLAGIVKTLAQTHVDPTRVQVLLADERDDQVDLTAGLPDAWREITVITHDPCNRDGLGYLAADKAGRPIYFGRPVLDADFVIPVAVMHPAESLGDYGIHGGLLPNFGDAATARQFASPTLSRETATAAASEAGWLLGSRFTLQVIPAPHGQIAHVFAGDIDAVEAACREVANTTWQATTETEPELVVACLGGPGARQGWRQVARALDAALQVVADDGTILLCCELSGPTGPALRQLAADYQQEDEVPSFTDDVFNEARALDDDEEQPEQDDTDEQADFSDDLLLAGVLQRALRDHRVYLYSDLNEDEVSALGLIHVTHTHEIANLCRRHGAYLILPDAEYVQPRLEVEAAEPPTP